ncbi:hypothetical protein [Ancylobacter defluvii]|nr:hypothetical protein [Ancylobacter defluvii]MBS7588943.1 hypothetical protein [Ancylobacter defluvii]
MSELGSLPDALDMMAEALEAHQATPLHAAIACVPGVFEEIEGSPPFDR